MDDSQIKTSVIKTSTAEVYDKTSNILRAIENCGCTHCIALLKSGLGNQPNPADADEHPKVQLRNVQR